jgi:hypothetical protein
LGFQSYPQLEATYGAQEAAAITGYCSTWVALRANDRGTARLISENLGQVEQVEANEGMSYGVNDMRDGVNLSRVQVTRPLVMPTEVMNLPNLTGYLRFGRDLPVIRFRDRFLKADSIQPGFVERHSPPVRLDGLVEGAVGTSDEATPPNDRTGTKVDELAGHDDTPSAPNQEPDRRQSEEARRILPLIGVSIHTVSRPDGPSRPATPA